MMKILMISRLFYPHVGGVERHVRDLGVRLQRRGHEIKLITSKYNKNLASKEKICGIEVFRFEYPKTKFIGLLFIWVKMLNFFYLFLRADVIHIHDTFIWILPLRFLFPFKKMFVTFHGYEGYPIKKSAIVIRKVSELFCSGNICIGNFISKWYGTTPTFISYGAVDTKRFKPTRRRKFRHDGVFASRLDDQTGILTYLKTVEALKENGTDFNLVVLGDGQYKKQAKKIAETIGFVDDPSSYLRESRFAFVSRYLAILEALSSKKLVFAVYDNPLKEDYLKMAPFAKWIVIQGNARGLSKKVQYYLKNPRVAEKLIEPAYKWVQRQTWEKMADLYEQLWGIGK